MRASLGERLRRYAEKDGRGYPDWAMRYVPIVRRLNRSDDALGRVLEIGANENGLSRFLGQRVVAVDIERGHLQAARSTQDVLPVVASIDRLPFRDKVFAVCASVDTFEHIPSRLRTQAVKEVARVMHHSGTAVVTFPSGPGAESSERAIREAYEQHCGGKLRWLEEHAENGLPDPGPIFIRFQRSLNDTHCISLSKNANLRVWRWTWRVLMCGWPGWGNAVFQVLLRLMTPMLARVHVGACYRVMIWVEPREKGAS